MPHQWCFFLLVPACLAGCYGFVKNNVRTLLIALFLFAYTAGCTRFLLAEKPAPTFLAARADAYVTLVGEVVAEPDMREDHTNLTLHVTDPSSGESGNIIIVTNRAPAYAYGDTLRVSGTLVPPSVIEEEGSNRVFDYPNYLRKDDIFFLMYRPRVTLVRSGEDTAGVPGFLLKTKAQFLSRLSTLIPEPESALLSGILLGEKRSLGERLLEAFRAAGLIHLIVLSGYNISLVADFIRLIFRRLPRPLFLGATAVALTLFAFMTGAGATVLRATFMGLLVVLARASGRTYDALHALVVTGLAMIFWNPLILAHDPSFQLSFLATAGLIAFAEPIERKITFMPKHFGLRGILATTLAAQTAVLPLIVYLMGSLSLISIVANVIVLPWVACAMALGALAGVLSFISSIAAIPFALATYLILSGIIAVAEIAASLPLSHLAVPAFPLWLLCIFYAPIAWVAYQLLTHRSKAIIKHEHF